jgi:uracil DNA glycosylase
MSDGKLLLEAKEDMKKRGMPSPNEGNAVALCFSEPNGSPFPSSSNIYRKLEYPGIAYPDVTFQALPNSSRATR